MPQKYRTIIVGGGLAGLATAHALRAVGEEAEIYEAANALTEVGAAIATSPQASKALQAIGLGEALAAAGDPSPALVTRNMQTGELLDILDNPANAVHYRAPYYTFHRADLIDALATDIDPKSIHLGHRLVGLEERAETVMLSFANGTSAEAECVIGADGVRSTVRQALYGDDNPTYTGQIVWRAILKGADVPPECLGPSGWVQWVGPGSHFMAYYMRGTELVTIVTQEDTQEWVAEGWSTAGDPEEMRRSFPNPEPRLEKLLSLVTECSKWGLFTRPLTDKWGRGRVQLVGDAAHAMLPNVGQGACQAFEDAYILGRWIQAHRDDPAEAFRNFRRVRIPRVHSIQRLAMRAAQMKHMKDADAQKEMIGGGDGLHGNMDWVLGFEPETDWRLDPIVPVSGTGSDETVPTSELA